jgi:hypothetical protein
VRLVALATERADWRVVTVDLVSLEHVATDGFGQRRQQCAAIADHVGEGRATHLDTVTAVDLTQPVQRHMVGELADHDMREQTGACHTTIHWPGWCQCLRDRLAARTRQLWAYVAHDVEGSRHVVQNFRDVLANLTQATAARGAVAAAKWRVNDRAARQVFWQLAQPRPSLGLSFLALPLERRHVGLQAVIFSRVGGRLNHRGGTLATHEFELRLGVLELLAGAAVFHAPQVREFDLHLVDGQLGDLQSLVRTLDLTAQCSVVSQEFRERHDHDFARCIQHPQRDMSRQPFA